MKTGWVMVICVVFSASAVMAETAVKGTVTNKSNVEKSANMALGEGATANMGSVTLQNSKVDGTITNQANVKQSANMALGKGAEANMGSVVAE